MILGGEYMDEKNDLVTIIVPVYNVQNYLDRCLKSIVGQTYKKIEILLINDGSTDKSGDICGVWAKKDQRISYICKENEGLGPTRNLGIKEAKGNYVMFVDSDDWVDSQFVEKLYRTISISDADIAECDFWREAVDSGVKAVTRTSEIVGRAMSKADRMIYGNVTLWKMIVKTSFLRENHIEEPKLPSAEDIAVYSLMIACSKKIASINEPLYHYQKGRVGAITSSIERTSKIIKAMQYLLDGFRERDIFQPWEKALCQHILRWSSRVLVTIINKVHIEDYQCFKGLFIQLLKDNFAEFSSATFITIGGYNLTKILQNTHALENPYARYNFQSIVSIMGNDQENVKIPKHKNSYRNFMLQREFKRDFIKYLSIEKPNYIIIDFLEERHDLLRIGNSIYTYSDALKESDFSILGEILPINTEKTWMIWMEACLQFIELLKYNFKVDHVVLVENLLAERHGDIHATCEFDNIDEIRATNAWLSKCYAFFKDNISGIQTVNLTDHAMYFTDDKYEYGCYPWHLNTLINIEISKRMKIER